MSITLTIDGKKIEAQEGSTILNVATQNGIKIPNLCYDGRVDLYGKTLQERARLLISVAHPSAREELARAARERFGASFKM